MANLSFKDTARLFGLPICDGAMSEKNTFTLLKIIFPECEILAQHPFSYQTRPRKASWKVDYYIPEKKLVVEYDGPDHYTNIWKIKRDVTKDKYFSKDDFKIVRIPYWLQIQSSVSDYLFSCQLSKETENEIAKQIYKVSDVSEIMYSGLYQSQNTPANFIEKGRERFKNEFNSAPKIVQESVRTTLKAYIHRVGDVDCVLPDDPRYDLKGLILGCGASE